jgi:bleomycin hydrolase
MRSNRFFLGLAVFFAAAVLLGGQGNEVGVSPAFADFLRMTLKLSPTDTALMNAVSNNQIQNLVLNREFLNRHNDFFSNKIETKGITDQKSSGRCWLFAGLNFLRQRVIKKYKLDDFEFSQSYLFFWDKMEKANFFLEYVIHNIDRDPNDREFSEVIDGVVGDGGYWQWVAELIGKYGVVPQSAMPETYNSSNSWPMTGILREALRTAAAGMRKMYKGGADSLTLRDEKFNVLKDVYKILVLNLSEPPRDFIWRYEDKDGKVSEGRTFTPQSFFKDVVGINLREYVSLMDYAGKEYNKLYQLDLVRNVYDAPDPVSANLPMSEIKKFIQRSVLDNEPVWYACDIGKETYGEKGILSSRIYDYLKIYPMDQVMSKAERIQYLQSASNHAMVITAVDILDGKPVKWLVENSHGKEAGHDGYYTMYDDWLEDYSYEAIINVKYLTPEIKAIFQQKPIHLPLWDPMTKLLKVE